MPKYSPEVLEALRKTAVEVYDSIDIKAFKDVNIKDELGIEIKDTEE